MTQPNFRRFSSRRRSHSSLGHWGRAACDVVDADHGPLARSSTLGRYRILELLGQGGMGTVYRAEDTFLQRQLAIKVLDRGNMDDAEAVRRFLLEAQTMAQLDHPNVVHLFDAGTEDKYCYLVMELIDGADGEALLANGPLDWRAATEMIADACRGLAHAHAAGMIHRDIKPGNILRGTDGVSHLSDFGLVKMLTDHWPVTMPHAVIGTPDFMSPEQFFGERVGPASDIYSLGATYFALLTGHAPFESAQNLHELAEAHRSWRVPDPRTLNPAVPAACVAIIHRAMAKPPTERYLSAREMLADLEALLQQPFGSPGAPRPSHKPLVLAVAGGFLVGLILLGIIEWYLLGLPQALPPHGRAPITQGPTATLHLDGTDLQTDLVTLARPYVGQRVTVTLCVRSIGRDRRDTIYLNPQTDWRDPRCLPVIIRPELRKNAAWAEIVNFPQQFVNKIVSVTGEVVRHPNSAGALALQPDSPVDLRVIEP
jgi:serine/threonine protein kinase